MADAKVAERALDVMQSWIMLLRGVNVGGKNLLPMADLRGVLADNGCRNVATYIQSGNAVFQLDAGVGIEFAGQLETAIESRFGFRAPICLLQKPVLDEVITAIPFDPVDAKTVHLYFRLDPQIDLPVDQIKQLKAASETLTIAERVLYLHAPDGIGRSKLVAKLSNPRFANLTGRNLRSCLKLQEMAKPGP